MRTTWFKTCVALASATGLIGSVAEASPAGMALRTGHAATPVPPQAVPADADRPTANLSPVREPIKYFTAALSELPIAAGAKGHEAMHPEMPAALPGQQLGTAPTSAPTPESLISQAQASEKQGDIAGARQHYARAMAAFPRSADVLRAAARMEDRLGDLRLAEQLYQRAVATDPEHAGALNDLGLCLARQGRLEASAQVLEQAIQLQPQKALYRNNLATVLVEQREDQKALAHLVAVHGAADANYNLGQLLIQRGRSADAAPYFQAAVQQNPHLEPARVALAQLTGKSTVGATTASPSTAPAAAPPAATAPSAAAPAPEAPAGPQFYYPTSARPPHGAAPGYASTPYPATAWQAPSVATQPPLPARYLPPVATQPGPLRR